MNPSNPTPDTQEPPANPHESTTEALSARNKALFLKLGLPVLAIFVLAIWAVAQLSPKPGHTGAKSDSEAGTIPLTPEQQSLVAFARVSQREALAVGQEALGIAGRLEEQMKWWNNSSDGLRSLRTSTKGRLLAARDDYVLACKTLFEKKRRDLEWLSGVRTNVEDFLRPVRSALELDSVFKPSEALKQNLTQQKVVLEEVLKDYQKDAATIDAMLATTKGGSMPASFTLQEAIDTLDARQQERVAANVQEEIEQSAREHEKQQEAVQLERLRQKQYEELRQAKRQAVDERCRALAADPAFTDILREVLSEGEPRNPWAWQQRRIATGYHSKDAFYGGLQNDFKRVYGNRAHQIFYQKRDKAEEFGLSVWQVYRILVQYRRNLFLTHDQCQRLAADENAKRRSNTTLIRLLVLPAVAETLPPPNTPPEPIEDIFFTHD